MLVSQISFALIWITIQTVTENFTQLSRPRCAHTCTLNNNYTIIQEIFMLVNFMNYMYGYFDLWWELISRHCSFEDNFANYLRLQWVYSYLYCTCHEYCSTTPSFIVKSSNWCSQASCKNRTECKSIIRGRFMCALCINWEYWYVICMKNLHTLYMFVTLYSVSYYTMCMHFALHFFIGWVKD